MSVASVTKMKLTNKNAPPGYPTAVMVENHDISQGAEKEKSIALFTVFEGHVVIGFAKKGKKSMSAFGLADIVSIRALRHFIINLSWDGKAKDAVVTKQLLLDLHAEVEGKPKELAYLNKLIDKLKL